MNKVLRCLTLATTLTMSGAAAADAAAVRVGETTVAIAAASRGSAVAYDSVNHVYLVVSSFYQLLWGRFVDKDGRPVGAQFKVQSSGNLSHFPGVTFSPDADGGNGGFLVVWHENDLPNAAYVHARVVSLRAGGPASGESVLTTELPYWEQAPSIAYSTASHEFLVAWARYGWGIRAVRVDNNAAAKGPILSLSQISQNEGNPSVSYNPVNDTFVAAWKGFNDAIASGFVDARLIQAGTNNLGGTTRVGAGGGTGITDVAYQSATNQFLIAWYRDAGSSAQTSLGRLVNADLSPAGDIIALSSLWKSIDALGVAYNPITNSFFMVSHDNRSQAAVEDGGVELNAAGIPVDNGFLVTAGAGRPNFYPKIAASTKEPTWLVSTAYGFESTKTQLLASGAVGPPPPAASQPMLSIDMPGGRIVQQPFMMAGWGLDRGATAGNGADVIHVWAWTSNGTPLWLGAASVDQSRPDLGGAFGAQFGNSGWQLTVNSLPPGTYLLAAYLHSTVTNSFSVAKSVQVAIPDPIMSLDTPGWNAVVPSSGFWLGGWAIDRGAPAGSGVDALHMWAIPHNGTPARWIGVATTSFARPDVGAVYGAQFSGSGYNFFIPILPPGGYDIVVFSHSSVTDTFSLSRTVRVFVQ